MADRVWRDQVKSISSDRIEHRCRCGARVSVPASAAGRRARCPKCREPFTVEARQPPQSGDSGDPRGTTATNTQPDKIRFRCGCGTGLAMPASAAGKRAKCPKCGNIVLIPQSGQGPSTEEGDGLDSLLSLAQGSTIDLPHPPTGGAKTGESLGYEVEPLQPWQHPGKHNDEEEVDHGPARTCPSCQKAWPGNAKICTDCGINLKSGRALLTTQDDKLDEIYTYTEGILRWASWISPLGWLPIASEAFGLRKPWATRGFAILTVLVSIWFLFAFIYNPNPSPETFNLMHWVGQPPSAEELEITEEEILAGSSEEGAETAQAVFEGLRSAEFRGYQLFTSTLLHQDPFHLLGNMIFLMVLGARVNALIGNLLTLILYPLFGVAAGIVEMIAYADEPGHFSLGASGAIMGLAGMYLILFPTHKVHMAVWYRFFFWLYWMRIFAVRGFWVVLFFISFDIVYTVLGAEDGTAHWAHLGGFFVGAAVALVLLLSRLVNARGGDLLSAVLGRHAWGLIGKPNRPGVSLW